MRLAISTYFGLRSVMGLIAATEGIAQRERLQEPNALITTGIGMSRLVGAIASDAENNGMIETMRLESIAAVNGMEKDAAFGSVTSPLRVASRYTSEGFERPRTREYSRTNNPTRDQLAATLAMLEGGAAATVVATGMAAVDPLNSIRARPLQSRENMSAQTTSHSKAIFN